MKDFRAHEAKEGSISYGPVIGGSAFHLPDIVSPLTNFFRFVPALGLAVLLRPWRLLPMLAFRRGGIIGAFFSWGRLLSLILALLFLFSPLTVKNSFPEWRLMTTICFGVCAISVVGAITRCCGSLLSCAFWSLLTLFLAEKAFKPESFQLQPAAAPQAAVHVEGDWEDLVTGAPVSRPVIVRAQQQLLRPPPKMTNYIGNTASTLSDSIFSIIPSTNSVFSSVGISGARDWVDGQALPDSAYFGGAPKVGAIGESSGLGESGSPIDKVVSQVSSYIGF